MPLQRLCLRKSVNERRLRRCTRIHNFELVWREHTMSWAGNWRKWNIWTVWFPLSRNPLWALRLHHQPLMRKICMYLPILFLTCREVNIKLALTRIKLHRSQFEPQRDKVYEDIARDLRDKKHGELVKVKVERLILDRYIADATVQVEFLLESLLGSIKVIAQKYDRITR